MLLSLMLPLDTGYILDSDSTKDQTTMFHILNSELFLFLILFSKKCFVCRIVLYRIIVRYSTILQTKNFLLNKIRIMRIVMFVIF